MSMHEESIFNYSLANHGSNGSNELLKNTYRVVILGAPKSGKTSIINWFFGKSYRDNYIPTIEDFHRKIYRIRSEIYRLDILDMSGNDPFPAMKNLNIMLGDLFIVVFSIDDIDSYTQMKKLCEQIVEIKKLKQHSKVNSPILVIGNKLDLLYDNKIKSRCFNSVDFEKFLSTFKSTFYHETSCKNSIGLERAFENFFFQIYLPTEMVPSKHRRVSFNLDLTKPLFRRGDYSSNEENFGDTRSNSCNSTNFKRNSTRTQSIKIKKQDSGILFENRSSTSNINEQIEQTGHRSSFKSYARKSFKKMTFRRHNLNEPCGTVWLNARRPSIRAELNLLKIKTNLKSHLPMKRKSTDDEKKLSNRRSNIFTNFFKLFSRKKSSQNLSSSA